MRKSTRGFTLVELLIVCAVILILVAIAITLYTQQQKQTRDSKRKADIILIREALEKYYEDNGEYPDMYHPQMKNSDPYSQTAVNNLQTLFPGIKKETLVAPNATRGTLTSLRTNNAITDTSTYGYFTVVQTSGIDCTFRTTNAAVTENNFSGYYILMYREETSGLVRFYRSQRGGLRVDPSSNPTPPQTCEFSN